MTVKTKVQVEGDSRDAVKALNDVKEAAKAAETDMSKGAKAGRDLGAGMSEMSGEAETARATVDRASAAVSDFVDENQTATSALAETSAALDDAAESASKAAADWDAVGTASTEATDDINRAASSVRSLSTQSAKAADELSDASDALDDVKASADGAEDKLSKGAKAAIAFGAGMITMEAAMSAARTVIDIASASIDAYAEQNDEAAERLAGTSQALEELKVSMGQAIIGGDNLEIITGALNTVFDELKTMVGENEEAMQGMVVNGMQLAISAGFRLAQGLNLAAGYASIMKSGVLILGDGLVIAAAATAGLAYQLEGVLNAALASVVRGAASAAQTLLDFGGGALGGLGDNLQSVVDGLDEFSEAQDAAAEASRANAEMMDSVALQAWASIQAEAGRATDALLEHAATHDELGRSLESVNQAINDGTIAQNSRTAATEEGSGADERAAELARQRAEFEAWLAEQEAIRAAAKEAHVTKEIAGMALMSEAKALEAEKEQEAMLVRAEQVKLELEWTASLDAARQTAADAEMARKDAERSVRDSAISGTLAGFGRLTAGNDKMTKALNIAAGARLAGQAVVQLNTGVGYALSGAYASGVALIAQSVVSFAEAAKLGFGGGGKKGGARTTNTTVNQQVSFSGPVDASTAGGFADQLQAATRSGASEGAR